MIEKKKMIALGAGAALTATLGIVAAKPLALLGLGSLVMTVWAVTFQDSLSSDLFSELPQHGETR